MARLKELQAAIIRRVFESVELGQGIPATLISEVSANISGQAADILARIRADDGAGNVAQLERVASALRVHVDNAADIGGGGAAASYATGDVGFNLAPGSTALLFDLGASAGTGLIDNGFTEVLGTVKGFYPAVPEYSVLISFRKIVNGAVFDDGVVASATGDTGSVIQFRVPVTAQGFRFEVRNDSAADSASFAWTRVVR